MLIYIIVYLILYLALVFGQKTSIKQQQKISYALIILFTLLRGLRWKTGTDWDYYEDIFKNVDQYIFYEINQVEWGFLYFNKFIKCICNDYTFYLIVTNLLFLFSFYKFSRYCFKKNPLEAFCICLMCLDLFPVRQSFAVSILIWAVPFLLQRKYGQSVLVIIAAYFVHRTSLVMLLFLLPLVYKMKIGYLPRVGIYLVTFVFSSIWGLGQLIERFLLPLLPSEGGAAYRAALYMTSNRDMHEIGIVTILITCAILYCVKLIQKKDESLLLLVALNAYYIHQMIFVLFQDGVVAEFSRLAACFSWGYFILIMLLYKQIPNKTAAICFMALFFLYKFNSLFSNYPDLLIPYYNIFDDYIPNRTF